MYGIYMTRVTTANYGTWLLQLCIINAVMAGVLSALYHTWNYVAIFVSSGVLLSLLEFWMVRRGMRTSRMFVYGKLVSPLTDSFVKGVAEGPSLCVPALFAADQIWAGHYLVGIVVPMAILFVWSLYWAFRERQGLNTLKPGESPIINRRWMNKPEMMFFVGIINMIVGCSILWGMPESERMHAIYFIVMFFVVLQVFFMVHSYYGVRRIDKYDPETKVYAPAGAKFSFLGYTYDSIFEMAMLNTPYYLIPYAFGLIKIGGVA